MGQARQQQKWTQKSEKVLKSTNGFQKNKQKKAILLIFQTTRLNKMTLFHRFVRAKVIANLNAAIGGSFWTLSDNSLYLANNFFFFWKRMKRRGIKHVTANVFVYWVDRDVIWAFYIIAIKVYQNLLDTGLARFRLREYWWILRSLHFLQALSNRRWEGESKNIIK